jgi:MinD superfamily P-loop ATPase
MTTGTAVLVGSSGLAGVAKGVGLAQSNSGALFGSPLGANNSLVTYSKVDGSATTVATLSGAPFPTGSINAMAFNSSGTLFGVNVNISDAARPTDLVTINTTTGVVSDVGASVNTLDAIVFVTVVPEPSTYALFGIGLLVLAVCGLRRRSSSPAF